MELFKKIIAYAVFAIQILIAFVLVFERQVEVPAWLQAFGRLHPLLLHLPIGLLLLTAILFYARKFFESPSFEGLINFLLYLTSLTASFSAFMGLLLSLEGGYNDSDLVLHKWLGITLSFFCWFLLNVSENQKVLKPALASGVVLLIFTGHFGANLTHGENFVLGPLQKEEIKTRVLTDSSTLFAAAIEPILESKCFSCHNEQKAKGRLILTSLETILKGGKNGVLWKAGDPDRSLIIERLSLPLHHKEHMPPKDKAQLTDSEILFISQWINSGADTQRKLRKIAETDTLKILASSIITRYHQAKTEESQYHFAFASQQKIQELSTPYRTVFQIARNEPALQAEFYLSGSFQKKYLDELSSVRHQIVSLNLSRMPITDEDLKTVSQFENLEKIVLNNTSISGSGLNALTKLSHLQSVSLAGTKVTAESLKQLGENKNLKEVYIWNTPVDPAAIGSLQKEFAHITWEIGFQPDAKELLRLSPPFIRNDNQVLRSDEPMMLKHNLPGAVIRYSLNEQAFDSTGSPVYKDPIEISGYTIIRAKAFKEGWLSSNQKEYIFFKKGFTPASAELTTKPDSKYPGEGSQTLIDDKKGMPDFYRDPSWMAFRNEPLEAYFYFEGELPSVKNVTLSFAKNIGAMCMPPSSMEVWGGSDPKNLKLLKKITPAQPTAYTGTRIEGASVEIPASTFACYKIVARPLSKLPVFRKEPKEKGWLMVDEVFFN